MTDRQIKAKEWLSKASNADRIAKDMYDRVSELNSRLTNMVIPMGGEKVSSSTSADKMADAIIKVMELKDEYLSLFSKYAESQRELVCVIKDLEDETEKQIITLRFVDGLPFYDVADRMGYSERQVYNIYNNALDHVADLKDFS